MLVSAEIRWFWPTAPPAGLADWFHKPGAGSCPAGGGGQREDEYLRDAGQAELGIKRRGGKQGVEVKGLVARAERDLRAGPFAGPIEIWTKWTSAALALDAGAVVKTGKRRWVRKFATTTPTPVEIPLNDKELPVDDTQRPARGCNVELTEVTLAGGEVWWTLGFEAFGGLETVVDDLRTVATALAARQPPDFSGGLIASYPRWFKECALKK